MNRTQPPPIDPRVIEWLEEVFQDRLPEEEITQFQLGLRVGEQRPIKKLRAERARQEDNILEV